MRLLTTSRMALLFVSLMGSIGVAHAYEPAEQALMRELKSSYPQVTRWRIDLLWAGGALKSDAEEVTDIAVMKVGVRSAVRVTVRDTEGKLRRKTLWYAVCGYQTATAALRRLPAGSALSTADLAPVESDVVAAGCAPFLLDSNHPQSVEGFRTRVTLEKGAVVCAAALERRPAVARDAEVGVRYLGRSLQLTTRAIAQTDAEIGMPVTVKSLGTREIFTAVVSGVGEVTVHE